MYLNIRFLKRMYAKNTVQTLEHNNSYDSTSKYFNLNNFVVQTHDSLQNWFRLIAFKVPECTKTYKFTTPFSTFPNTTL